MLALPAINTGVFVYQSFILESKNWGDFVIAKSFMFYAILSVGISLVVFIEEFKNTNAKIIKPTNSVVANIISTWACDFLETIIISFI